MSVATTWGSTPAERAASLPCDRLVPGRHDVYNRGISVQAPPEVIFRWLCQLRVAPYSYDWIDNRGRRSPRSLDPELQKLARGQRFMQIFELEDFEPGVHVTLVTPVESRGARLFGIVRLTYWSRAEGPDRTRLLVKLRVIPARGVWGRAMRAFLPWGDLVMMRRQLLTLKALAEATARSCH